MSASQSAIGAEWARATAGAQSPQPTEEEKKTLAYVTAQVTMSENAKRPFIRDASVCMAFFAGRQMVEWDPGSITGYLKDVTLEDWQSQIVVNLIQPIVESQAAKATENRPALSVVPATDDEDDVEAARLCESLLEWVWEDRDMQGRIHEFAKIAFITGTAFFKVWWDKNAGDPLPPEPEPALPGLDEVEDLSGLIASPLAADGSPADADLAAVLDMGRYLPEAGIPDELAEVAAEPALAPPRKMTGAVRVEPLSVFEVGIDPGAKTIEDARWAYHLCLMHRDEVAARWPNGHLAKCDASLVSDAWSARFSALEPRGTGTRTRQATQDHVRIAEYFERGSPRHPDGRYIVTGGGVLLEERDVLPTGDLPFVVARHRSIPGRLLGDGTVKSLVSLQAEYNDQLRADIETSRLMADPKWRVAKGSLVNGDIRGGMTGEIVEYDPLLPKPEPIAPPPWSPIHQQIATLMGDLMGRCSQSNDIVFGDVPNAMSGRAIGFWMDQMASTLGPTVREIECAIKRVGRRVLGFYRDFGPETFLLRLVGRSGELQVREFKKSDIRSTDVKVVENSMLPKHLQYQREQLLAFYAQDLFGDRNDPRVKMDVRKRMEFGDITGAFGDVTAERKYAREVNAMILAGQIVNPLPEEKHEIHIDELNRLRMSDEIRDPRHQFASSVCRWKLAWHGYFESMLTAGHPWWHLVPLPYPQMPPVPMQPGPAPAPGAPPPPPPDPFGPDPAPVAPAAPQTLPPEVLAALSAAQPGPNTMIPELERTFPVDDRRGPGIGPGDAYGE